jgi:sugar fermentation stimulation protein A
VVFVIQRPDATRFAPNDATDPEFGAALREATAAGVAVHAYACRVSRREIEISRRVPVRL